MVDLGGGDMVGIEFKSNYSRIKNLSMEAGPASVTDSLNRTIVGLKDHCLSDFDFCLCSLNRTIVGLKVGISCII